LYSNDDYTQDVSLISSTNSSSSTSHRKNDPVSSSWRQHRKPQQFGRSTGERQQQGEITPLHTTPMLILLEESSSRGILYSLIYAGLFMDFFGGEQ